MKNHPVLLLLCASLLFLCSCQIFCSCSSVAPGSDPLVVRCEQVETGAYATLDEFLKADDLAMQNPAVSNSWATSAHPFAAYLRKPVINGTNDVPFGIGAVLSLDQVKLSYERGIATSNALVTAISVLDTTVAQATQYTSLIPTK